MAYARQIDESFSKSPGPSNSKYTGHKTAKEPNIKDFSDEFIFP
jgi:hypothetical protein